MMKNQIFFFLFILKLYVYGIIIRDLPGENQT